MRVNPLSLAAEQFCLLAQEQGVHVVNDPAGAARTRAKAWLASLPADVPRPRTLVTGSRSAARNSRCGRFTVVVKPASGSGGRGVSLVPTRRHDILERSLSTAAARGVTHVVLQEYLSEARDGEKRIVWVDGVLLGAYQRQRADGDFRHNLKQGARPTPCTVDAADQAINAAISPHLVRNGIRIAGLDVIGGRLVEVNTLNPGGVHWADSLGEKPTGWIAGRPSDSWLRRRRIPDEKGPMSRRRNALDEDSTTGPDGLSRKQVQDALRRGQDLRDADLRGLDLAGLSFDGVDLSTKPGGQSATCTFRNARLSGASLWQATFRTQCWTAQCWTRPTSTSKLDGATSRCEDPQGDPPLGRIGLDKVQEAVRTGNRLRLEVRETATTDAQRSTDSRIAHRGDVSWPHGRRTRPTVQRRGSGGVLRTGEALPGPDLHALSEMDARPAGCRGGLAGCLHRGVSGSSEIPRRSTFQYLDLPGGDQPLQESATVSATSSQRPARASRGHPTR